MICETGFWDKGLFGVHERMLARDDAPQKTSVLGDD